MEQEISDLEAIGDDRVLVRAFGLLAHVHGMGLRAPTPAATETSDQLDLQGNGLLDFARGRGLAGAPADAAILSDGAAWRFKRGGNVASARRARWLAERLLSKADRR